MFNALKATLLAGAVAFAATAGAQAGGHQKVDEIKFLIPGGAGGGCQV